MPQPDVRREDVIAAIEEFDRLGRDAFLEKYQAWGFSRALDYFVNHNGRLYDSKVLLAASHGLRHGDPLYASDFSGGDAHAAKVLKVLGFTLTEPAPDWSWDELVLACDLVAANGWRELRTEYPQAVELSALLQRLSQQPQQTRSPRFRSPSSVSRKTSDLMTAHPDYAGGHTRGSKLDHQVVQAFRDDPTGMAQQAAAIRSAVEEGVAAVALTDLDDSADEGGLLERRHLVRERDRKLRQRKINDVLNTGGRIACEVCTFDFERTYGTRGRHYIEVHHRTPLHVTGAVKTNLADLALLCSNCHRMIHRGKPWLNVEELAKLLRS